MTMTSPLCATTENLTNPRHASTNVMLIGDIDGKRKWGGSYGPNGRSKQGGFFRISARSEPICCFNGAAWTADSLLGGRFRTISPLPRGCDDAPARRDQAVQDVAGYVERIRGNAFSTSGSSRWRRVGQRQTTLDWSLHQWAAVRPVVAQPTQRSVAVEEEVAAGVVEEAKGWTHTRKTISTQRWKS